MGYKDYHQVFTQASYDHGETLILWLSCFLSLYHSDEISNYCLPFCSYDAFWMELNTLQIVFDTH